MLRWCWICSLTVLGPACQSQTKVASTANSAHPEALDESVPTANDLDTSGAEIPTPLAPFDALNETERVLAADLLRKRAGGVARGPVRVRFLRDRFLVLVPDADRAKVEEALLPLFSAPTSVAVESRIRDIASLGTLGASRVRPEFVRGQAIDFSAVWSAIVNAFPSSCELEIDSTSVRSENHKSTFHSHVVRVPSSEAFSGVVMKKRIRVELV